MRKDLVSACLHIAVATFAGLTAPVAVAARKTVQEGEQVVEVLPAVGLFSLLG